MKDAVMDKQTGKNHYGNSPEYFQARRRRLGASLRATERERWHSKRKNTVGEAKGRLVRSLKGSGIKKKDIPSELGEVQLLIIQSNRMLRKKKMAKGKKKKVEGITALRDLILETMEAGRNGLIDDTAVKLINASAAKAIQAAVIQNTYHKRMGHDGEIPFLEK